MTTPAKNLAESRCGHERSPTGEVTAGPVDRTCRAAVDGRRAARRLAAWSKPFELSEPEFQLLWNLRPLAAGGRDQTSLARQLALSPAQVSATVERLRRGGWILALAAQRDRRRHCWQLTDAGHALLAKMLVDAERLHAEPTPLDLSDPTAHQREQAA